MKKRAHIVERTPVECIEDVELIPGFRVIEHTYRKTVLEVPSGFTLEVTRAGPFLYEILDKDPDYQYLGPYTITVTLMSKVNPPGIEVEQVYEPPLNDDGVTYCPDADEHPRAYAYYQGWKLHEIKRKERVILVANKRKDLALANCVKVVSGSTCMEDDNWYTPISDFVEYPNTKSGLNLLFLKTQVVTTEEIRDVLIFLWSVKEVTIEGLKTAFDQFWSSIPWATIS